MFDIQNYGSFILAVIVFQMVPGPSTISILNATARGGMGSGFAAVAGTLTGDLCFMLAAVAGLAAVMQASPEVFIALQWIGVGYLCWAGLQLLRTSMADKESSVTAQSSIGRCFRQGLLVCLTNPKTLLFFFAFFPLFLGPQASLLTLAALILHVSMISFLYQVGLVLMGNHFVRKLRKMPAVRRWSARLAGLALIGFGFRLAIEQH